MQFVGQGLPVGTAYEGAEQQIHAVVLRLFGGAFVGCFSARPGQTQSMSQGCLL